MESEKKRKSYERLFKIAGMNMLVNGSQSVVSGHLIIPISPPTQINGGFSKSSNTVVY